MVKSDSIENLCIVQARLTSSRLPNKVLKTLGSRTIVEHVYDRLLLSHKIDRIVFAIPDTNENNSLFDFLLEKEIPVFRGDENNVLSRYYKCAKEYMPQRIIRATCDNPLVSWELIDRAVQLLIDKQYDYVGTHGFPLGTGTEVFTWDALTLAYCNTKNQLWKEHVTPFFYKNPDTINIATINNDVNQTDTCRLTIDTLEDYELMKIIYDELYDKSPISNDVVMDFLDKNPQLLNTNNLIIQRNV
ncbi:MAG: glycosyltransferase family protein [Prevotellaceae bacterium]|jgi:spore coat polysaccharide biosynthesis protein SpsF|nr:glycosyltransferase family protein [Prevotellaceae bacterium]